MQIEYTLSSFQSVLKDSSGINKRVKNSAQEALQVNASAAVWEDTRIWPITGKPSVRTAQVMKLSWNIDWIEWWIISFLIKILQHIKVLQYNKLR